MDTDSSSALFGCHPGDFIAEVDGREPRVQEQGRCKGVNWLAEHPSRTGALALHQDSEVLAASLGFKGVGAIFGWILGLFFGKNLS